MDLRDSLGSTPSRSSNGYLSTLLLAYQSFGVVFGDLSISPIYVYKSTFSGRLQLHEDDDEIFGVLSLVFWTLTITALMKYTILVLGADDHGEGGTFALYSLICRNSRMGLLNIPCASHQHMSVYDPEAPSRRETRASFLVKDFFEKHQSSRIFLLLTVLLGTGMVVGDGILTPSMSVLSAVTGVKVKIPELHENYTVFIACIVLVTLFALQQYGTHRVGFLFAPILIAWLICLSGVGIYNINKWNTKVIRAISPYYIYNFFNKSKKDGWSSLGGIVLCITGAEAMFADLGHFSKLSIRIAFTGIVYPCLTLAYMGEAAYLSKHRSDLQSSFYKAIPEDIFWPVFVIATLATVVGSQAIISATFSIISQCRAMKCFPRVKIVHTSTEIQGQIYIPEVNWILMTLCLAVIIGFRDPSMIGNAYGLAVITVMFVTTCLMFLVIITVWEETVFAAVAFAIVFGSVELLYLSSCLIKVPHGGWLSLVFSLSALLIMASWHYGTSRKERFEMENKVCIDKLLSLGPGLGLTRIPGVVLVYSDVATGVPPIFAHFVTNFPAFHRFLIFVSVQSLTIPRVPLHEKFLIERVGPWECRLFRCIVRYGYKDERRNSYDYEDNLIMKVAEFLQHEEEEKHGQRRVRFEKVAMKEEVKDLLDDKECGVTYMMGHTHVKARDSSPIIKKIIINFVYGFLRQNCRHAAVTLGIPVANMIEVGMVYHV